MKKVIFLFTAIVFFAISTKAQKVYATKAAQVKFASNTAAESFEAVNNQTDSKITDKGLLQFTLLIKGFKFENELMQEHFNKPEYMDSDKYPKASFKGTIVNIDKVNFAKDGAYPVMVDGDLTIRGITKKTQAAGVLVLEKGKLSSKSTFKIKLTDFGLKGKDIGTVISNNIEISVSGKYE